MFSSQLVHVVLAREIVVEGARKWEIFFWDWQMDVKVLKRRVLLMYWFEILVVIERIY